MEGSSRVARQPGPDLFMLVGCIVVEDHVDDLAVGVSRLRALRKRMNS